MKRYNSEIEKGLTLEQVKDRIKNGDYNIDSVIKTKKISEIIFSNIFTLFNILNFTIAFFIFLVGSYKNLLFLGVVISNILISTIQEIRSKK